MSKLERWLPFRFNREKKESKTQEARIAPRQAEAGRAPGGMLASFMSSPMQQWVKEMFDDPFFREPFGRLDQIDRWFGDFSPQRFSPSLEVSDEGKALKVTAELPGMNQEDIKLRLDDGMLTLSGEKRSESESKEEGVFRNERYYGFFQRTIPLPEDIDAEKAEADFRQGVLTVRFPKLASPKSSAKQIEVKAG